MKQTGREFESLNILDVWHRRLGHINEKYIRILCPFIPKYLTLSFCPYCAISKLHKKTYKQTKTKITTTNDKSSFRQNVNASKHFDRRSINKQNKTETLHNISMYSNYKAGGYIFVDLKHM